MLRAQVLLVLLLLHVAAVAARSQDSLPAERPLALTGAVGVSIAGYAASGIDERRTPFTWTIAGTIGAEYEGLSVPLSFTLSEHERTDRQPYNQVAVNPTYGALTGHLGHTSMTFSRYSLAGVSFLGAGIEWKPGTVRLAAMTGRLQRAVEEDSNAAFNLPAYERTGYAFLLGFGDEAMHVDLAMLRATDDTTSLRAHPVRSGVTPADNAVFAIAGKITVIPELILDFEGALSLFTRNRRSPSIDIDSTAIPSTLADFFPPNISSTLSVATRAGVAWSTDELGVRLGYERIEPDFTSLGTYYLLTDLETWTLEPRFVVLDGELSFAGSIGVQHDNLLDLQLARTNRVVGTANVGWLPSSEFGLDASFTNLTTRQVAGREPINDTVAVRDVTFGASLAPRLLLASASLQHFIGLVGSMQRYTDQSAFSTSSAGTDALSLTLLYNLAFVEELASLGGSLTFTRATTGDLTARVLGMSANGTTSLFEEMLAAGLTISYARTTLDNSDGAGDTFSESLSGTVRITPRDAVTFLVTAMQNSGDISAANRYSEVIGTLSYSRTLSWSP